MQKENTKFYVRGIRNGIDLDYENADFTEMGDARGNIHISKVLHKTFISVDEAGTKAGAATGVVMDDLESDIGCENEVVITLDRPFVYMIIENETNTPIFMGTLDSINN